MLFRSAKLQAEASNHCYLLLNVRLMQWGWVSAPHVYVEEVQPSEVEESKQQIFDSNSCSWLVPHHTTSVLSVFIEGDGPNGHTFSKPMRPLAWERKMKPFRKSVWDQAKSDRLECLTSFTKKSEALHGILLGSETSGRLD